MLCQCERCRATIPSGRSIVIAASLPDVSDVDTAQRSEAECDTNVNVTEQLHQVCLMRASLSQCSEVKQNAIPI
ncbi:Hypothetical predicted protein [Olea europaea subsp. europaea]|uniref:Uncharacterized protein n=1 Tax=Olea europaea subsp. europaea TaxID=158383 RepID=A0A8S0RMU4_OLEEU|nr:Hypothetical predicted protein [Olea europaea subsp. europaea]